MLLRECFFALRMNATAGVPSGFNNFVGQAIMESNPLSYQYRGPDRADVYVLRGSVLLPVDRSVLLPVDRRVLLPVDRSVLLPVDRSVLLPVDRSVAAALTNCRVGVANKCLQPLPFPTAPSRALASEWPGEGFGHWSLVNAVQLTRSPLFLRDEGVALAGRMSMIDGCSVAVVRCRYSSAFKAATGCADVACLRELPLAAVANASAATIAVVHPQSLSDL